MFCVLNRQQMYGIFDANAKPQTMHSDNRFMLLVFRSNKTPHIEF